MPAFPRLRLPALLLAALPLAATADVPIVEPVGQGAQIRCNVLPGNIAVNAVHADKIIFSLTGVLQAKAPADQPALDQIPRDTELDIKVLDDPTRVADLRGKVLSFIGAVDNAGARAAVKIIDVDYAMVCPLRPFTPPPVD